ncbi:hypothetical protein NQ095_22120 [Rossellomorea sp. SC111]|uniref:RHS repeat-associated core domain-containing protein n=1 Tax=Rossellomorea sp. SC111 TaxID=2968985 RepID=UPI00215A5C05|nr:RHS repeat-associated core domain-containing protein [Rossellomorea sp. SC111]MCR8851118.1 hypothetical protein [Rossellomorea sp. SC111]
MRGSVTNVVDSEVNRVKGYDYDDFGNIKEVGDKTIHNEVKFTGAIQDSSTGLHYMNARYYSSDTGRFISQDTYSGNAFDPWTQHMYTYTSNNPINYVDPTGHYHVDPDGNKILPNGAYIQNRSQPTASKPSTSHISTPSGSSKSKPSAKMPKVQANKVSGKAVKKIVQRGLGLVGFVPGLGAVADGINALIYAVDGDYTNAGLSLLAAVPIYGDGAKLGLKAGGMISRAVKGSGKYQVGAYKDIKGVEGLDAHHAGQKALMKKLVNNYNPNTAPAINVPKVGHTIKGPNGIVSRSTKGIDNPRQLLARDITELRRVYDDIPNSSLKELIGLNKKMYPEMRK